MNTLIKKELNLMINTIHYRIEAIDKGLIRNKKIDDKYLREMSAKVLEMERNNLIALKIKLLDSKLK